MKPMTLGEWAALDEDVEGELVDGVLAAEELPSFLHEIVVAWLIRTLSGWASRRRALVAASEAKIAVGPRRGRGHGRAPGPDVAGEVRRYDPRAVDRGSAPAQGLLGVGHRHHGRHGIDRRNREAAALVEALRVLRGRAGLLVGSCAPVH